MGRNYATAGGRRGYLSVRTTQRKRKGCRLRWQDSMRTVASIVIVYTGETVGCGIFRGNSAVHTSRGQRSGADGEVRAKAERNRERQDGKGNSVKKLTRGDGIVAERQKGERKWGSKEDEGKQREGGRLSVWDGSGGGIWEGGHLYDETGTDGEGILGK